MTSLDAGPFVSATASVLESLLGIRPAAGRREARPPTFMSQECVVVTGITGMLEGYAIFGMSVVTACRVAGAMLGQEEATLDEMALSALAELANMITGNAASLLSQRGILCDLTPPSILNGEDMHVSLLTGSVFVIPFHIGSLGLLELTVAIRKPFR